MLKRFWFEFSKNGPGSLPIGVNSGCGVSGYDYDDALIIVKQRVFDGAELPTIEQVIEDVDISTLDENHILPNMGNANLRGVWFPLGY
jgi:hypothetical protein